MTLTSLAAAALALAALTAPAMADDSKTDSAATTAQAATAAAFTVELPIEALMADERAKAVVVKHLPEINQHPAYEEFKVMSLKAVAPFSQGLISDALLAKIAADLAAIQ